MDNLTVCVLCSLATFSIGMLIAKPVIKLVKRLKAGQIVLGYVEQHKNKSGIPTMGGVIFIIPVIAVALFFAYSEQTLVAVTTIFAYGVLGFLDDFIKVKFKQNLGLRAYQKIIGQVGIALIVSLYAYKNALIGTEIIIPFTEYVVDFKGWYVPFTMLVYIAATNCVNLTDGLDGLAASTSLGYFVALTIILLLTSAQQADYGLTRISELTFNMSALSASLIGGLAAFLWYNSNPASIFMGDTGSLALGGAVASVAVFTRNPFLIVIIGITFVWSGISVILQVIVFKLKHRRVFLMAPYHHHLEKKGIPEQKIVWWYFLITLAAGFVALLS